jgi:hypothetical protein
MAFGVVLPLASAPFKSLLAKGLKFTSNLFGDFLMIKIEIFHKIGKSPQICTKLPYMGAGSKILPIMETL